MSTNPDSEPPTTDTTPRATTVEHELAALQTTARSLERLDDDARGRVLRYLLDRFKPTTSPALADDESASTLGVPNDELDHARDVLRGLGSIWPRSAAAAGLLTCLVAADGVLLNGEHDVDAATIEYLTRSGIAVSDGNGTLALLPYAAWGVFDA